MCEMKTLLLCKVKPTTEKDEDGKPKKRGGKLEYKNYSEIYKTIYKPTAAPGDGKSEEELAADEYHRYITLGGFDALAVYSPQKENNREWLEAAWKDKKQIINHINNELSYHPIHLVRSGNEEQGETKPPVLLLTFIYGIGEDQNLFPKKDDGRLLTIGPDGRFRRKEEKTNPETVAEVYRCINISDRVLLIYTSQIREALKAVYYLEVDGQARRTYTTVNFLLDENGNITESCYDILERQLNPLKVMIQGTIRNAADWEDRRTNGLLNILTKGKGNLYEAVNFGEADFLVAADVTGPLLKDLLKEFISNSNIYASGCWDIHTEIQLTKDEKSGANPPGSELKDILAVQENRLNTLFLSKELNPDWEWKYVLKEVLSAQASIDRHPMFSGPSYLLWDCFDVINDYLEQCANRKKTTIPDIDADRIPVLIAESGDTIQEFIRCISQLTDQLTRNDDIIFRGLGRIPAITSTLPENLLEIYHAFLRKLADFLIQADNEAFKPSDREEKWEYKFGFLIAPEMYQRPQIFQLFQTDVSYRKASETGRFSSWPTKQCHVIKLPLGDVYSPMQCLIPLVHECFHFFGDTYRSRTERAFYIMDCLAAVYVDCVLYGSTSSSRITNNPHARMDLISAARVYLASAVLPTRDITILEAVKRASQEKTSDVQYELFLDNLISVLRERFYSLLSEKGTREIYYEVNRKRRDSFGFVYYPVSVESRQDNKRRFFWDSDAAGQEARGRADYKLFNAVKSLFKECYADFMTMTVLGLEPKEYLRAFNSDLEKLFPTNQQRILERMSYRDQGRIIAHCQRIGIVLAAYYSCSKNSKVDEELKKYYEDAIREDFLPLPDGGGEASLDAKEVQPEEHTVQEILSMCFNSLIFKDNQESGEQLPEKYDSVFPATALRRVVDYLKKVYVKILESGGGAMPSQITEIREEFANIFRSENLFGSEAETLIRKQRDRVENKAEQAV